MGLRKQARNVTHQKLDKKLLSCFKNSGILPEPQSNTDIGKEARKTEKLHSK